MYLYNVHKYLRKSFHCHDFAPNMLLSDYQQIFFFIPNLANHVVNSYLFPELNRFL